jgi:hypothetical protein
MTPNFEATEIRKTIAGLSMADGPAKLVVFKSII